MEIQFTAAAERALKAASGWANGGDRDLISPVQLLLGLLDEAESRAAEMLTARGIDAPAVLARWPRLVPSAVGDEAQSELSTELRDALATAASHLHGIARPLELATEHLLLGLVASHNELADWLAERGFAADELTEEIRRLHGYVDKSEADVEEVAAPLAIDVRGPWPVVRCDHGPRTTDHRALLRLIDAAANRAREGLRVVEDFVRFVGNDRHLTANLKQLRHDLAAALAPLAIDDLLAARDTLNDVGTNISTATEGDRLDVASVVTANFKRLQEALRSLEEFGKVLDPAMARQIEQIRYRTYALERAVAAGSFGLRSLAGARLYVLMDGRKDLNDFTQVAQSLIAAGVDLLQLRDKRLSDRELLQRADCLRELTRETATLFIMNDRPDLARLADADGVHVGQDELPIQECRAVVGPRALIGVSTHSLDQARQAVLDGANYIGVGPTFASRTKSFSETALTGLELLRAVHAEISLPAFAIGGIEPANLLRVLSTGITRIAVSGAVLSADDPGGAAREFLQAIQVASS
jgi:thiamine-phosphate pyrophosphorylase